MVKIKNDLVFTAINKVVGEGFSIVMDRQKDNTDIVVMFVAIIMHVNEEKSSIMGFCRKVFKKSIIKELVLVLKNIDDNLCIMKRSEYGAHNFPIQAYPILEINYFIIFYKRWEEIIRNWMFLLAIMNTHICEDWKGLEWYLEMKDLCE